MRALVFPLWSTLISGEQYDELDPDDRCRCARQPAGEGAGWLYVPLTHLDGVDGGFPCINLSLANSVRFARPDEMANCRISIQRISSGRAGVRAPLCARVYVQDGEGPRVTAGLGIR